MCISLFNNDKERKVKLERFKNAHTERNRKGTGEATRPEKHFLQRHGELNFDPQCLCKCYTLLHEFFCCNIVMAEILGVFWSAILIKMLSSV